jgi:DNA-binding transcriptional LysR family regulator
MIDLQQLETFRVLAATNNFTRAAVELGYCQSTVTAHIKALESELGASLFIRRRFSKTVELTEAGFRTLEYARRLLALAHEAKTAALLS